MSVAKPADTPLVPLTRRLRNPLGSTTGSSVFSSKFGFHATVSLPRSRMNSSAMGLSRASV
jgi:hypothetical protein